MENKKKLFGSKNTNIKIDYDDDYCEKCGRLKLRGNLFACHCDGLISKIIYFIFGT